MSEIAPPASVQDEVMEFLLTSPSPQQIIDFHASDVAQERLRYLLEANRSGTLTEAETAELDDAEQIDHFVTLLKAKAHLKLKQES
jgi:hypothetical protein